MAYIDDWNLMQNSGELKARCEVAVAKAALAILTEDPGTTNHDTRSKWAKVTLQDSCAEARKMIVAIIADSKVSAEKELVGDEDLQSAVDVLVNIFAE